MEIYNRRIPRKVVCVKNESNMFCDNTEMLEIGKKYTVVDVVIHPYNTDVYLEEFPSIRFNSVCFEEIK